MLAVLAVCIGRSGAGMCVADCRVGMYVLLTGRDLSDHEGFHFGSAFGGNEKIEIGNHVGPVLVNVSLCLVVFCERSRV